MYGHSQVVESLLSKGAKIDSKDMNGKTPLSLAATEGHPQVVESLLSKGAKIDSKDRNGNTPLSLAV